MKKTEAILLPLIVVGIFSWFFHFPFSSVILIISLSATSFYYAATHVRHRNLGLNLLFSKKEDHSNSGQNMSQMLLGWGLAALFIGILFKLMFWPNYSSTLLIGLILMSIGTGATLIKNRNNNDGVFKDSTKKAIIIGGFGLLVFLTPINTLVDFRYRNNPEYAKQFKRVMAEPRNEELRQELNLMREKMHNDEN
ncbi:MAG: hypothetical protein ACPGLV_14155 [Bacteroidia bacterium]